MKSYTFEDFCGSDLLKNVSRIDIDAFSNDSSNSFSYLRKQTILLIFLTA